MRVLFEMLREGAIPLFDYEGDCYYLQAQEWQEGDGVPIDWFPTQEMHWRLARSYRVEAGHPSRFAVPLFETTPERFVEFLRGPLPQEGVLRISVRANYLLDGDPYLMVATAIFSDIDHPRILEVQDLAANVEAFLRIDPTQEPPELGENPSALDRWLHEEWLERRERLRLREIEAEEIREKREEARKRSRVLLVKYLTGDQLAELEEHRRFKVIGADGLTYLVTDKHHANVWLLEGAKPVKNYCIIVPWDIPIYDQMLAQKVMLETNLAEFTETANITAIEADRLDRVLERYPELVGIEPV